MSRITKQIATDVAKQLVAEKSAEILTVEKQLSDYVTTIYMTWIPQKVKETFSTNQSFFRKTSSAYLTGRGFNRDYFSLSRECPDGTILDKPLDEQNVKDISALRDKVEYLKKERDILQKSIKEAIFNLHTYNNVEKEFPEAFKLLPASSVTTGLMINIKDIRCKLDSSNCA